MRFFERWWYRDGDNWGSRWALWAEHATSLGVAVLLRLNERLGSTNTWNPDGSQNTYDERLVFELKVHLLVWEVTLFYLKAEKRTWRAGASSGEGASPPSYPPGASTPS